MILLFFTELHVIGGNSQVLCFDGPYSVSFKNLWDQLRKYNAPLEHKDMRSLMKKIIEMYLFKMYLKMLIAHPEGQARGGKCHLLAFLDMGYQDTG